MKHPYRYRLRLEGPEEERKIKEKLQDGMEVNFSKPVTNKRIKNL